MASLMPNARQQFFNSSTNTPIANGYLYTYAAGTTTPKATYTSAAATVQNANPIRLDARGEATVFWDGAYYIELHDANDVLIYSQDYYTDPGNAVTTLSTNLAATTGANLIGFKYSGASARATTVGARLSDLVVTARSYGAIGDGNTHPLSGYFSTLAAAQAVYPNALALTDEIDGIAIQAALNDGYIVDLCYGVYRTTYEIVPGDNTGIIGRNGFWKRRTGYTYSTSQNSVVKYVGASGSNTCVIRASKKAVGTFGTDFTTPGTDDLVCCTLKDFHVDANSLADYACYFYRCGNSGSMVDGVTAEKAVKDNHLMLGIFAAFWGTIGGFEAGGRGIVVANDVFSWSSSSSSEWNCYNFCANFISANNGTDHTFVEYTAFVTDTAADEYDCGIYIGAGRGSEFRVDSEANYGRSIIVAGNSSGGGPLNINIGYLESNGAGPKVKAYGRFSNGISLRRGFMFPVTQALTTKPETIKIYPNSSNDGPGFDGEWLTLDGLIGESGYVSFNVNSNTYKFKVQNSSGAIKYPTTRPLLSGVVGKGYFKADSTLSDIRYIKLNPIIDSFYGDASTKDFKLTYPPSASTTYTVYQDGVRKTITTDYAPKTFTVTIASPGVVSYTAHPFSNNDPVILETTGALPTGLTQHTVYYVVNKTADTFQLSATSGGAAINTSGSQSGTHAIVNVVSFVSAPSSGSVIVVAYSNMTLSRVSAGTYQITFNVAEPDVEYSVIPGTVQNDGQMTVAAQSKTVNGFQIVTTLVTSPTVPADFGDFVDFAVVR